MMSGERGSKGLKRRGRRQGERETVRERKIERENKIIVGEIREDERR